jgi:hypothetical protein
VEEVTLPAFTVNPAEVEPDGTVTVAGTLAAGALELESDTTSPPVPAGAVRLTVPAPVRPLIIELGLTDRLLRADGGGLTVIPNVAFTPESEAVKVTGVDVLTMTAVTGNVAELDPCGTVTVAGTPAAAGDALSAIVTPPLGAVDVSVTVQVDPADGVSDVGLQDMPVKTGVWMISTVAPLADVGMDAPVKPAERTFESWTDDDVSGVDPAKARVTEARTLFGMVVELSPHTRHVAVPAALLQERDLSASADPSAKVADVKSVVE